MSTRTRADDVGASINLLRSNNNFFNGLVRFNNDYNNINNRFSELRTLAVVERERLRGADEIQLAVERQVIEERISELENTANRLSTSDIPNSVIELHRVNQEITDARLESMIINGASEEEIERILAHDRLDMNLDINQTLRVYAVRQIEYIEYLRGKYTYEDREVYQCLEDLLNIKNNPELDGLSSDLKEIVYNAIYEELGIVQGEMDVAGKHPELATIYNSFVAEREHQEDNEIDNEQISGDQPTNDGDGDNDDTPEDEEIEDDQPTNDGDGDNDDTPEDEEIEDDQPTNDGDGDNDDTPEDEEIEDDQPTNDGDGDNDDTPEDEEIGEGHLEDPIGVPQPRPQDPIHRVEGPVNIRPNANAKWRSVLAIAAGIGIGAGVWFAFGGIGVTALMIGGGLAKRALAKKMAKIQERRLTEPEYRVHNAENFPKTLKGQLERFKSYMKSPEGLDAVQKMLTASIFSSLGFNILGPLLGLQGGQVITAITSGGAVAGGAGGANEAVSNSEAAAHTNPGANTGADLKVGDSAGNLTSGYTDSYSAQAGNGAVSLDQSLINGEGSHIGGFNVITQSGESIAVTDPTLTASQIAAQHRVPISNVIPRIVQNGTNADQAWSTISDVVNAQGGRTL